MTQATRPSNYTDDCLGVEESDPSAASSVGFRTPRQTVIREAAKIVRFSTIISRHFTAHNGEFTAVFTVRLHARWMSSQETQYLALILTEKQVQSIYRNLNCGQGKRRLHWRWNVISTFMAMATNADQRKWRQIRVSLPGAAPPISAWWPRLATKNTGLLCPG